MRVFWSSDAWDDYTKYWCDPARKREHKKLLKLIEECRRTPYEGTGRPERLKHERSDWWSRQIHAEHRLVYNVDEDAGSLNIASCWTHYQR